MWLHQFRVQAICFFLFPWTEDFGRSHQGRFQPFTHPFRYNFNPHAQLLPTPDPSLSQLPGPYLGPMPMRMFVLLLEGKANFRGTGTITAPSPDAIKQAPADLKERLDAIESVDLSGYDNIQGRRTCSLYTLTPTSTRPFILVSRVQNPS